MYNDPVTELLGQPMHFYIKIIHARGLDKKKCRDVFVRYKFFLDREYTDTKQCEGENMNPGINFSKRYDFNATTKDYIEYLQRNMLVLEVLAKRSATGEVRKTKLQRKQVESTESVEELRKKVADLQKETERIQQERDQVLQDLNVATDEKGELAKTNIELGQKIKKLEETQPTVSSPTLPSEVERLKKSNNELTLRLDNITKELEQAQKNLTNRLSTSNLVPDDRDRQIVELKKQVEEKDKQIQEIKKNVQNIPVVVTPTVDSNQVDELCKRKDQEIATLQRRLQEADERAKKAEQQKIKSLLSAVE